MYFRPSEVPKLLPSLEVNIDTSANARKGLHLQRCQCLTGKQLKKGEKRGKRGKKGLSKSWKGSGRTELASPEPYKPEGLAKGFGPILGGIFFVLFKYSILILPDGEYGTFVVKIPVLCVYCKCMYYSAFIYIYIILNILYLYIYIFIVKYIKYFIIYYFNIYIVLNTCYFIVIHNEYTITFCIILYKLYTKILSFCILYIYISYSIVFNISIYCIIVYISYIGHPLPCGSSRSH